MPAPRVNSRLRQVLKKIQKPHSGWLDLFPAVIGKADGTVLTGTKGEIFVRNLLNGQVLSVYNFVVPNKATLQVEVGRRVDQLGLWQVKGALETYDQPAGGISVPYHAEQHQFPNGDTVFINRKQITALTVLVSDAENFIVQVYGSAVRTSAGIAKIHNQAIDLSSYVPASGAVYLSIESDVDGVLSVHEGTGFAAPGIATAEDIPIPDAGKYMLAFILLFAEMDQLKDEHIVIPMQLETDYAGISDHTHDEILGEILMEDGVTFPPVPLTNETGDDWIYDN